MKLGDKVFKNRKEILNTLESNFIGARPYYFPLSDLTLGNSLLTNSRIISESHIILPIGHSVNVQDIPFIIKILDKAALIQQ